MHLPLVEIDSYRKVGKVLEGVILLLMFLQKTGLCCGYISLIATHVIDCI